MPQTYAGFDDIGYLHAEGAKAVGNNRRAVRPFAAGIVAWFRNLAANRLTGQNLERVYWYDGAFNASDHRYSGQLQALNAIAQTPDLEHCLGYLVESRSPLEHPITTALVSTETGLSLTPGSLLTEFRKHWQLRPQIEQKRRGCSAGSGLDKFRQSASQRHSGAHRRRFGLGRGYPPGAQPRRKGTRRHTQSEHRRHES